MRARVSSPQYAAVLGMCLDCSVIGTLVGGISRRGHASPSTRPTTTTPSKNNMSRWSRKSRIFVLTLSSTGNWRRITRSSLSCSTVPLPGAHDALRNLHRASGIGAYSASAASCRTGVIQYVVPHVPPLLRSFPILIVKHHEQQDVEVRNSK